MQRRRDYDPEREYQGGEARAIAGEQGTNEVQQELAAVLSAADAKALVQRMLARRWAARDRLTLRLPPARIVLEPGNIVEPDFAAGLWLVDKCTIEGFVTIAEMRPLWQPSVALPADAGRIVVNSDIVQGPISLALIDASDPTGGQSSGPVIMIAASSPSSGWSARSLTVSCSEQTFVTQSAARKSLLGTTLTSLGPSAPYLIDQVNFVDVELIDKQQWLTSCDDAALAGGLNFAVLGNELVQFGNASPLGDGRFRLSRLLRGRCGTERACRDHSAGETFCLLEPSSLRPLALPAWMRGSTVKATDGYGSTASLAFAAESVRPLAPVNLRAELDMSGDLFLNWTRRSRAGFAWLDEVDAPLGESREQYRVTISGPAGQLELTTDIPSLAVAASDLVSFRGTAGVRVQQIGDWAALRPSQLTIELSQE